MSIQEARLVNLFLDLVGIDSPSRHEKEVADFYQSFLRSHDVGFWEDNAAQELGGNANNLIVHLPATAPQLPRIFLSAHLDTVESTRGLTVQEFDGVFRSSGNTILGADDKCGVAAATEALLSLRESGEPHGDVFLLITVAEEIGLLGAKVIPVDDLNLDFGFVLDTSPPVGTVVNRTAYHDRLHIKARGKPAHAGKEPEAGINAIRALALGIARAPDGRIDRETTANVGLIEGGSATNIVASEAQVFVEARSLSVEKLDRLVDEIIQAYEAGAREVGATVEIEHHRHYSGFVLEPSKPVVRIAQTAAAELGLPNDLRSNLGGSDANVYNQRGIPCVVLATGMDLIHTHEERITRRDLVDTARMARHVLSVSQRSDFLPT